MAMMICSSVTTSGCLLDRRTPCRLACLEKIAGRRQGSRTLDQAAKTWRGPPAAWNGLAESGLEAALDQKRVEVDMALQCKVAGIDQVDIDVLKVPRIGQRARRREERVVPTPDHQRRGLVLAEIRLPERILCEVVAVVVEQVELDLRIARTVEEMLVERPRV